MIGIGSSTLYKIAVKEDGSPNWTGIGILCSVALAIFVWRCVVIGKPNEVLVRMRWGKVVTRRRSPKCKLEGYEQFATAKEYDGGVRLRLYAVHSLLGVNVADRKATLEKKTVTFLDRDYAISPAIRWRVSRDNGCPSKALFNVQDGNPKDKKNTELESIVLELVDDAIIRAYALLEQNMREQDITSAFYLPVLTVEEHLSGVSDRLYARYGVEFCELLYGEHSVSPAQREKEGNLAIAAANEKMAEAQNNMAAAIRSHGIVVRD